MSENIFEKKVQLNNSLRNGEIYKNTFEKIMALEDILGAFIVSFKDVVFKRDIVIKSVTDFGNVKICYEFGTNFLMLSYEESYQNFLEDISKNKKIDVDANIEELSIFFKRSRDVLLKFQSLHIETVKNFFKFETDCFDFKKKDLTLKFTPIVEFVFHNKLDCEQYVKYFKYFSTIAREVSWECNVKKLGSGMKKIQNLKLHQSVGIYKNKDFKIKIKKEGGNESFSIYIISSQKIRLRKFRIKKEAVKFAVEFVEKKFLEVQI